MKNSHTPTPMFKLIYGWDESKFRKKWKDEDESNPFKPTSCHPKNSF